MIRVCFAVVLSDLRGRFPKIMLIQIFIHHSSILFELFYASI